MLQHNLLTISSSILKYVISIETSVEKIRLNRSTMEGHASKDKVKSRMCINNSSRIYHFLHVIS
jgi:hypothetical protein